MPCAPPFVASQSRDMQRGRGSSSLCAKMRFAVEWINEAARIWPRASATGAPQTSRSDERSRKALTPPSPRETTSQLRRGQSRQGARDKKWKALRSIASATELDLRDAVQVSSLPAARHVPQRFANFSSGHQAHVGVHGCSLLQLGQLVPIHFGHNRNRPVGVCSQSSNYFRVLRQGRGHCGGIRQRQIRFTHTPRTGRVRIKLRSL